jgi:hypothetical protein
MRPRLELVEIGQESVGLAQVRGTVGSLDAASELRRGR